MEQKIKIKTPDKKVIYGTLNYREKTKKLIIFVHGITGHQNEHHYFNAVPFFNQRGFATLRFDFYSGMDKARSLSESSLTTHVKDLALIMNHFKSKYKDLFLIGHSLGALVILKSDLSNVDKIVLWDPTTSFKNIREKNCSYSPQLDKYILHWGMEIIVGKEMMEEWKKESVEALIKNLSVPSKFIFAEKYGKYKLWKPFLGNIKVKHEITVVKNATHCFDEEGTEEKLFQETLQWIKKL